MIRLFLSALITVTLATPIQAQGQLRLAVTTSFHNSGLADVLLPEIHNDLGIEVQLLVVGTGQAIRLGQAGDVDAILVHSKTAENAFVTNGFATHRREIMYNDFVIIGPQNDPAGLGQTHTAAGALTAIAAIQAAFISRGDDSGTHKAESALWDAAGISPMGGWYKSVGAGMGAALNTAAALDAYILSDRASWLNFGNKGALEIIFEGDPALFNQYAFLPVNPDRHPHVKTGLTAQLEDWLVSGAAAALINDYTIGGQQLFTHNAKPLR